MNKAGFDVRPCKRCRRLFTPQWRRVHGQRHLTEHCSWLCAVTTVQEQNKGKAPLKAVKVWAKLTKERRAVRMREQFGHLSDREVELVAHAEAAGYRRGYNAGFHASGRKAELRQRRAS